MSRTWNPGSGTATPAGRGVLLLLAVVAAAGAAFVVMAAAPYFRLTPEQFRGQWPRRWWLLLHIVTGIVALMSGPVELWLGLARRRARLHRGLGIVYLASVGVSAVTAYHLALHTDLGWIFGAGLAGLATAWIVTTGLAFTAIRRGLFDQHKEWMVRSYVVTTAFVSFRLLVIVLSAANVGTPRERLAAASWFCWAIPLLITEALLQGRKVFGRSAVLG
jgi:hypothetical protein